MQHKTNINFIIDSCKNKNRDGQKRLYHLFYGYALSIALSYSSNREEAEEVVNDSFLKVFKKISTYDPDLSFRQWFRVIIIHTAIDYHRKFKRFKNQDEVDLIREDRFNEENLAIRQLEYEDVIKLLQNISPACRVVFNLYVMEGYSHPEIAKLLNVSVGTSKSNLAKARKKLKKIVTPFNQKKVIG